METESLIFAEFNLPLHGCAAGLSPEQVRLVSVKAARDADKNAAGLKTFVVMSVRTNNCQDTTESGSILGSSKDVLSFPVLFFFQYHEESDNLLQTLLERVSCPLVVLLDGLDHVTGTNTDWVTWVPRSLPSNVRFIISVTSDSEVHNALKVIVL